VPAVVVLLRRRCGAVWQARAMVSAELENAAVALRPTTCLDRSALMLYCVFPLTQLMAASVTTVALAALGGRRLHALLVTYLVWAWFVDSSLQRGGFGLCWRWGITGLLRRSLLWRWAAQYFPVRLHATASLPPNGGPYIFVCHPHGIFGISPMTTFGTDATDFTGKFPGIAVHLLGHSAIFRIPFFREWCLMHGHGSVDRQTCHKLLRQGHSIALAPGGARESLESTPGSMRLFLAKRKGFAKLALQTGATLVPVIAFGENELYSTIQFRSGTWARAVQEKLQRLLGFALPVFCGRTWMPLLPKRLPVDTIVGAPLRPELGSCSPPAGGFVSEPSREAVDAFHSQYCEALRALFDAHKAGYGAASMKFEIV